MSSLEHALVRNALFGGGGRVMTLAVGLVMTPYLLHSLGTAGFGIWALVAVVTGAAGLLDPAFRSALVKHFSEADALRDGAARDTALAAALLFTIPLSVVVVGTFVPLRGVVVDLLRIPGSLHAEAADAFLIGIAGLAASWVLGVFPALLDARQRMDLTNGLGVVCLVATAGATVVAVESGFGVRGVAAAQLGGIVAFHLGALGLALRLVGPFRPAFGAGAGRSLAKILRFGLTLHISTACSIVNRHLDKLLLTRFAGLGTVASYEIGLRVAANAGSFQPFLSAALLPAASHLETRGDRARLRAIYSRASGYLFAIGIPPFIAAALWADVVVLAWIGRPDPLAAAVLRLLAGGYLVNSSSNAMAFVCQGVGRPDIQARQAAVQLAANVVLSVVLLAWLGPLGAPLGTSLALVIGAAFFAARFHPTIGTTTFALLRREAFPPAAAAAIAGAVGWVATAGMTAATRGEALLELAVAGSLFGAVYVVVCFAGGVFVLDDLRRMVAAFRRLPEGPVE